MVETRSDDRSLAYEDDFNTYIKKSALIHQKYNMLDQTSKTKVKLGTHQRV